MKKEDKKVVIETLTEQDADHGCVPLRTICYETLSLCRIFLNSPFFCRPFVCAAYGAYFTTEYIVPHRRRYVNRKRRFISRTQTRTAHKKRLTEMSRYFLSDCR